MTLHVGDPAPWFTARAASNPHYQFDTAAGRHVVLAFLGSASSEPGARFLARLMAQRALFDDEHACFFGVTTDPADEQRLAESLPGIRWFFDSDHALSRLYNAVEGSEYHPHALVLDPLLRILLVARLKQGAEAAADQVAGVLTAVLRALPPGRRAEPQAPVLVLPRVFEPKLCVALIEHYRSQGGRESGFMRDVEGQTRQLFDYDHKRRQDSEVTDEALRRAARVRVNERIAPEIRKAFQFEATRMERYIVACYEAASSGHFRAHRDNTTRGTAHRRFAVTINLNTGEYEGGDLRFPEFGPHTYCPPTGGALVFSCSLLHEVTPVTAGQRFAFLPFLYDEAAAAVREQNRPFLASE
jgi:predicted 2-oxoglutarate/Fe(II)-dependent dioxygenase YbiX/peroxiredoxin